MPTSPTILCFSTVDWDYLWHRPQVVMSLFAQAGYRVLYVDTLGLRSPKFSDLPRLVSRLRNRLRASQSGLRQSATGVHVLSPLLLPFLNSRLARRLNVQRLIPQLQRQLQRIGNDDLIIWVYLPTWTVWQCVEHIPHRALVYGSIDALDSNPAGLSLDYAQAERTLLERADLVITTSESLYREKAARNSNTHWVPAGVGAEFLAGQEAATKSAAESAAITTFAAIPGRRIGFFGTLDHRLDLERMRTVARAHREWSLVLIGPARCAVETLAAEENVHFLGPRPHHELVNYLRHLDVLWLPYVMDEFTRHVYPAKIFECLALGTPVVATALPSLAAFAGVVRLVAVEAGPQGHEEALRQALAEEDEALREKRRKLARENSWEVRFREIRGYVEQLRP